jgi:predicted esterase
MAIQTDSCVRCIQNLVEISKLKTHVKQILAALVISPTFAFGQICAAQESYDSELVTAFWSASTEAEIESSKRQLMAQAPDIETLYQWLDAGPAFAQDVALGQQESARVDFDGTRYPFVYLIPETYDATRSYPVEFMLHGGVSRPEWGPGGEWWRRGYDSLKKEDRIVVVPAAWNAAFWWFENQADNLPSILRELKQTYNIDDNRVTLSGVSDGGTGAYFFAFKQSTEWAAFLPYIGHPGVLRNPQSGPGYKLYFENLMSRPLYIVNGENDPLYPVSSIEPFISILQEANIDHVFRAIEDGGHNTNWLPDEQPMIEQFKLDNPRDPFPNQLRWVTDRSDRYNRNLWMRIEELAVEGQPGIMTVSRQGNSFTVTAESVVAFTLLLSPEQVDFSEEVHVVVNGRPLFIGKVEQDMNTLLDWVVRDRDKSLFYTAALSLKVNP